MLRMAVSRAVPTPYTPGKPIRTWAQEKPRVWRGGFRCPAAAARRRARADVELLNDVDGRGRTKVADKRRVFEHQGAKGFPGGAGHLLHDPALGFRGPLARIREVVAQNRTGHQFQVAQCNGPDTKLLVYHFALFSNPQVTRDTAGWCAFDAINQVAATPADGTTAAVKKQHRAPRGAWPRATSWRWAS